jgi:hypothetical protein
MMAVAVIGLFLAMTDSRRSDLHLTQLLLHTSLEISWTDHLRVAAMAEHPAGDLPPPGQFSSKLDLAAVRFLWA